MSSQTGIEPVVNSVTVSAPVERAFEIFTSDVKSWWPLDRYSVAGDEDQQGVVAVDSVIEPRSGGRWFEVRSDGSEAEWGEVLVFDPPHRLVASWHPGRPASEATEIEVRFSADGDSSLVELEHRGWERLGDHAAAARGGYASGWLRVLGNYAEVANS